MKNANDASKNLLIFFVAALCAALFTVCDFTERTIIVGDSVITFDAYGGEAPAEIRAVRGATRELPPTARGGYEFSGWYTDSTGGERVGAGGDSFVVGGHATFYAHWERVFYDADGDTIINGIVYVFVEAGTFTMGSSAYEAGRYSDEIEHEVTLTKSFWISKHPITNRQFGRPVTNATEDRPAVNVSWQEAMDFAERQGGSLPTEAQWEFAARGGNIGKNSGYMYSGGSALNLLGWYAENSDGLGPYPVGRKLPNQLGIYDMSGNVYEWCYDWYRFNTTREGATDPAGPPSGTARVVRGGSWGSEWDECRVARRQGLDPAMANSETGFRVVFAPF
ncbi:MAG: SUMF1/EgtB/PvdO family nonheme iron enzyme [Chitinispirillales bacterium]|jgi:uncharacterized repeat protein (TIGR02543 family)|nr:SUMF1/EgtB/PvdO family nonheme iron enzyme [Chitinispirillales bacterium]